MVIMAEASGVPRIGPSLVDTRIRDYSVTAYTRFETHSSEIAPAAASKTAVNQ
jgi:hypothetical protein